MFTLEIVSPDRVLLSKQVSHAVFPGESGEFGVLKGHQPMVIGLKPGIIKIIDHAEEIFIGGGFANIKGDKCIILTDQCIYLKDIKEENILAFIKEAEQKMEEELEFEERETLQQSLHIEKAKLEIMKRLKL